MEREKILKIFMEGDNWIESATDICAIVDKIKS